MRALPLIALTVALAACAKPSRSTTTITTNADTGVTTATTAGTPATAADLGIQPGKWETTTTVVDTKVEGAPPGMPIPPRTPATTVTSCVTPDQARTNPSDMLGKVKANCTISNNVFAGGKIASQASCKLHNGTMTVTTSGTFSPTEINSEVEQVMTMGPMRMTSKTHMLSHRVGACG